MCDTRYQNCGPSSPEDKAQLQSAAIGGGVFVAVVFAILLMWWCVQSQNKKAAVEVQARQTEEERRLGEREIEMVRVFEAQEEDLRRAEEGRVGAGMGGEERSRRSGDGPVGPPPAYVERG